MNQERLYKVILGPVFTEKAASDSEDTNLLVLKVLPTANKQEIKSAVEKLFETEVLGVRTLNVKGKTKRTRFGLGKRSDWKKAYINIPGGKEVDLEKIMAL